MLEEFLGKVSNRYLISMNTIDMTTVHLYLWIFVDEMSVKSSKVVIGLRVARRKE